STSPSGPGGIIIVDEDGDGIDDGHAMSGGCVGCSGTGGSGRGWLLALVLVGLGVRRRRRGVVLGMLLLLTTVELRAEEQTLASQRWQTTLDAKGLARTHSGALLDHLDFDVGLWGDYERNPVVLRNPDKGSLGPVLQQSSLTSWSGWSPSRLRVTSLVGQRFAGELTLSLGLFRWVELGVALPLVLYQDRGEGFATAPVRPDPLNQFAVGDIRLGGKIRILRQQDQLVDLALVPQVTLPVGLGFRLFSFHDSSNPVGLAPDVGTSRWAQGYVSEGFPTLQPEIALSRDLFGFFLGVNGGFRLRRPYQLAKVTVTQELLLRAGIGFKGRKLAETVSWMRYFPVELGLESAVALSLNHPYVAVPLVTPNTKQVQLRTPERFSPYNHSGEINATAGLDVFWIHPYVGAGVGVIPGFGTPDFRVLGGIRLSTEWASLPRNQPRPPPSDRDHDGILDPSDRCPDEAGVVEHQGCPPPPPPPPPSDADGDGLTDDVDRCPQQAEDVDGLADDDGCAEEDADQDGLSDDVDDCPTEAGGAFVDGCPHQLPENAAELPPLSNQDLDGDGVFGAEDLCADAAEDPDGFQDADGCPDPDNDHDGVPDATDQCALEAEVINGNADDDGCPDKGRSLVVLRRDRIITVENIHFEPGKAEIRPSSFNQIDQVARYLLANPEMRLRIEGHTDYEGSDQYNMDLSQRRADAVRAYLVKKGVEPGRVVSVGYGRTRPISDNTTVAGREKNRRVEFIIEANEPAGEEP
ncbi:MAG: OmpA family protein, partial [Myxococcota bacterium]